MSILDENQVKWMESMMNLEVRNFVVQLGRHLSLSNEEIQTYLEPIKLEVGKRQRKPASEKRCVARLMKSGKWEQCSHKYSHGKLCKTHAKMGPLKYGTILTAVPIEYRGNATEREDSEEPYDTNLSECTFKSPLDKPYSDVSLYPQSSSQLTEISIGGRKYLQDIVTATLYTYDRELPRYIGRGIDDCVVR
jgi:hypothetical protein